MMPTNDRTEWCRIFKNTVMDLAEGEADVLQMADWAVQAEKTHGHRNPVEVANEEWVIGTPPIPD
jgi:hypothetical protein